MALPGHPLIDRAVRRLRRRGRPPTAPAPLAAHAAVERLLLDGPAPLAPGAAAAVARPTLEVAVVIPWYPRGSGGHATIFNLVRGLEARGHAVSIWLDDPTGRHAGLTEAAIGRELRALFGSFRGPVRRGFARWSGADVALATSWPTVYRTLLLAGVRGRAYLVQDHEPEFHATSAEAEWAAATYGMGLHHIAASAWLADLLRDRYGASATHFDLGVDHARYRPPADDAQRAPARVVFYARTSTERRAVPLGLMALAELARRRPDVEIDLFGAPHELAVPFRCRHLGVMTADALADTYRAATVGMVLSMTNPSLVPLEMLACGLPCVDVERPSTRAELAPSGGVELAPFHPRALADALARLLDDSALRARRSRAGRAWIVGRDWARAAAQVERGLYESLRRAADG